MVNILDLNCSESGDEKRLYDILETMKKNQLKAVWSHFGALSDHSALEAPSVRLQ